MPSIWQDVLDLQTDIRYRCNKDSTTLTSSDLLRLINKWYFWAVRELIESGSDLYTQVSSTALVPNQREYPLPIDNADGTGVKPYGGGLIQIKRVEVSYDNTNFFLADEIEYTDQANTFTAGVNGTGVALIDSATNRASPKYYFMDRSIWLVPLPLTGDSGTGVNNTNLRIWWIQRPKELSLTTDIPNLPKDCLNILVEGPASDVFKRYGRASEANAAEKAALQYLERAKGLENRDRQVEYLFTTDLKLRDFS